MAINVHTPGRYVRRAQVRSNAPRRLAAAVRWLRAEEPAVISIRPLGGRSAGAALSSEQAGDGAQLLEGLEQWRSRVRRKQAIVALRRYLLLGVGLSLVLEGLALAGAVAELVPAVPVVLALVAATLEATRRPSLEQIARLLDDRLGLFDRIGTGLELQSHPEIQGRPLARRAASDAAGLTELTLQRWRASTVGAKPEWLSLIAVLASLAALALLVPLPSSAPGGPARTASTGSASAAPGQARASVGGPAASRSKTGGTAAPTPQAQRSGHSLTPVGTQQRRAATVPSHTSARSPAKAGGGHAHAGAQSSSHGSGPTGAASKSGASARTAAGQASTRGARGSAAGSTAKGAGISPVAIPRQSASTPTSKATKAPSSSRSSPTKASGGAASQGTRHASAGQPAGTPSAGHARGSTTLASPKTLSGQATHDLPLQSGYAPSSSTKSTGAQGSSSSGGGGRGGRSTSSSTSERSGSGSFAYVPYEGGAVAGGDAALLISYIYSLGFVEEQPW
jgi:hypothetical protein